MSKEVVKRMITIVTVMITTGEMRLLFDDSLRDTVTGDEKLPPPTTVTDWTCSQATECTCNCSETDSRAAIIGGVVVAVSLILAVTIVVFFLVLRSHSGSYSTSKIGHVNLTNTHTHSIILCSTCTNIENIIIKVFSVAQCHRKYCHGLPAGQ